MIERGITVAIPAAGEVPMTIATERAYRACGCQVLIGLRLDLHESTSVAFPCCDEHRPMIQALNVAIFDSLSDPQDRPLVEVIDELWNDLEWPG